MDAYRGEETLTPRDPEDVPQFPFPLEPTDISIARLQVASRIGQLPFDEYEECGRSLWVVFAGHWGVWVRAVVPVDDRLDAGDPATIRARCAAVANLLVAPDCYGVVIAGIVLRRPAPSKPTRSDRQILRRIAKAAAVRNTVPWSYYVTGFEGFFPLRLPVGIGAAD
jgi:hypothetical protein